MVVNASSLDLILTIIYKCHNSLMISIYFSQNVCIRQESGYCCVRYNLCADTYSFAVATGPPGTASSTQSGSLCTTDYVSISGVSGNCEGSNVPVTNRICGYVFGLGYSQTNAALSVCGK